MFFGKQKFDAKQLKLKKFTFDVKQLKMNRFIKFISDLIISTSNATLDVPSLRPKSFIHNGSEIITWMGYNFKTKNTKSKATFLR